ncbi:hypothetical protein TTHERM_00069200 (macronuclear) [Tetrahymena thermophila SB210]|uniref:Uncharacterized protein n=1 Tax=Tetrahymena thermophila (strain SB210) TaxID=312017 RepID=I7MHG4_TETTS|nr:hypothetical protein TTHERM_00069200 [Tetrahymena thermophila SB210]EAR87513.2 hypothetical protein TTHERM_00069200 [Tetrahymena thermophila SB210]|eukprot:XP_001007758.2 hypothetical protein TTHERM_00069200 [Tetrahymena thermophila SB210]
MYRQVPVSSKIVSRKIKERDSQIHETKLKQISSQIDTKRPDHFNPLSYTQNKKKIQLMEDKYTEIERENRILLEKITKIMNPPKTTSNKNQYQDQSVMNRLSRNNNYSTIQQSSYTKKKSLNQLNRRKELLSIMEENKKILERIKSRKSEYDHRKWEEDHKKNEVLLHKISEYPVNLYKKSDSKAMFTRNDCQYNPNGQNLDQSSASIKRQNYSLDRQIGAPQQKTANHKRDRSFHLEPLSNSNNKIDENKTILYRQSRQFGLNFYIVEISIENGIFRIIADDIENPLTRVLEMFENDGLKVLNKFFHNNLEELVSNLKITDKIYIKGLEKYQTEPSENYNSQNEKLYTDKSQILSNNKSSPFIFDKGFESQQDNGYTTNDSYQNKDQQIYTLKENNAQFDQNQLQQQQQLKQSVRRSSLNKSQNQQIKQNQNQETPNRKVLREITEQNSTNNNTLDSRSPIQMNERQSFNNSPNQQNNNQTFTNSKLMMDFYNNQQEFEKNYKTTQNQSNSKQQQQQQNYQNSQKEQKRQPELNNKTKYEKDEYEDEEEEGDEILGAQN